MATISSKTDSTLLALSSTNPIIKEASIINSVPRTQQIGQIKPVENFHNDYENYNENEIIFDTSQITQNLDSEIKNLNIVSEQFNGKKTDKFFDVVFWAAIIYIFYRVWKLVKRYA